MYGKRYYKRSYAPRRTYRKTRRYGYRRRW